MSDMHQNNPGEKADEGTRPVRPLRTWPAVVLLIAMAGLWLLPMVIGGTSETKLFVGAVGRLACAVLIPVWWLAASRVTGKERIAGVIGLLAVLGLTYALVDASMRGPGMFLITVPVGMAVFALAAVATRRMLTVRRTVIALLAASIGFGSSALLRNEGMWSDATLSLQWRWSATAEEQMLADAGFATAGDAQPLTASDAANLENPAWPEFRGPDRLGEQHGPGLATDWTANPPEEQWRIPVGPGWSSFAVAGGLLYTQEQRGAMEAVVCYSAETGQLHWIAEVEARFDDPLGGPGPRATPTLHDGGLYVMGAQGYVMRLDALTGELVWQQDLRKVADRDPPFWGFASSPLVVDGVVVVHAGGGSDKGVLAFDTETGELRWSVASGDHSYSSPQLSDIGGEARVLVLTNAGLSVIDPASGALQLDYAWPHNGYRALQPRSLMDGTLLLSTGVGTGTRRVRIGEVDGALTVEEVWTSNDIRPDFNDGVVHGGHLYGFDGGRFVCVDLETGERTWRGGSYGKGQVLLLAEAGQLLVTAEKGEVVLLEANPAAPVELTRFRAFEGKTWNHPVLIGDRLYVRNGEEAACYRMPLAG